MHRDIAHDGDNVIDWGRTSADYSTWRPNYPDRFFDLLETLGVGLPGQRILDLGTGVGFLALRFAQAGALSTALISPPNRFKRHVGAPSRRGSRRSSTSPRRKRPNCPRDPLM
jgi:hypothetical protein